MKNVSRAARAQTHFKIFLYIVRGRRGNAFLSASLAAAPHAARLVPRKINQKEIAYFLLRKSGNPQWSGRAFSLRAPPHPVNRPVFYTKNI